MKLFIALLFCTAITSIAQASTCRETYQDMLDATEGHRETITKCLNEYDPGLAGRFYEVVQGMNRQCKEVCAGDVRASYCNQLEGSATNLRNRWPHRQCVR